jgi:6-phosphogluconolactonase
MTLTEEDVLKGETARHPLQVDEAEAGGTILGRQMATHRRTTGLIDGMTEIREVTIDYGPKGRVVTVPDGDTLARRAAQLLVDVAKTAIAHRGSAAIALSGGSTPRLMGQILAQPPFRELPIWSALDIFWGDERWVPLDHDESNAGVAHRTFLQHVPVARERIYPMHSDRLSPEEAAEAYEQTIRTAVPADDASLPRFDLLFLGMGEDGHTASLFPETAALHENEKLVTSNFIPKLETTRVTLTAPLLNAGRQVVFLVSGAGKAERLAEVLEGPYEPTRLPSQLIRPEAGELLWLADRAAVSGLALPQAYLYG